MRKQFTQKYLCKMVKRYGTDLTIYVTFLGVIDRVRSIDKDGICRWKTHSSIALPKKNEVTCISCFMRQTWPQDKKPITVEDTVRRMCQYTKSRLSLAIVFVRLPKGEPIYPKDVK